MYALSLVADSGVAAQDVRALAVRMSCLSEFQAGTQISPRTEIATAIRPSAIQP